LNSSNDNLTDFDDAAVTGIEIVVNTVAYKDSAKREKKEMDNTQLQKYH
jgi:hypothetical protein